MKPDGLMVLDNLLLMMPLLLRLVAVKMLLMLHVLLEVILTMNIYDDADVV